MLKLYGYWRSSCSWRVRIALHYKNIDFEYLPVHLVKHGGEQFLEAHRQRNSFSQVPVLEFQENDSIQYLSQSIAIMEFLEEHFSDASSPPILPKSSIDRASVRQMAEMINSGIQPIQNLAVLKKVTEMEGDKVLWAKHWIQDGLEKLELHLTKMESDAFLFGNTPTIADFCLIPQLYNARRFQCDMTKMPRLLEIEERCSVMPAFIKAHPDNQLDAQA